jgi:hypothetical protein
VAYDEGLAQRIRESLDDVPGISEKKMFGGLAFLLNGNMACGVVGEDLMVRVGPKAYATSLAMPHVREMNFTGRPMRGLVFVRAPGFEADRDLDHWVGRGVAFAQSLPSK